MKVLLHAPFCFLVGISFVLLDAGDGHAARHGRHGRLLDFFAAGWSARAWPRKSATDHHPWWWMIATMLALSTHRMVSLRLLGFLASGREYYLRCSMEETLTPAFLSFRTGLPSSPAIWSFRSSYSAALYPVV